MCAMCGGRLDPLKIQSEHAGMVKRVAAAIIDGAIVTFASSFLYFTIRALWWASYDPDGIFPYSVAMLMIFPIVWLVAILVAFPWLYYALMGAKGGQTYGKKALEIGLVAHGRSNAWLFRVGLRETLKLGPIYILVFVLTYRYQLTVRDPVFLGSIAGYVLVGALSMSINAAKRGWYDRASGTYVIVDRPNRHEKDADQHAAHDIGVDDEMPAPALSPSPGGLVLGADGPTAGRRCGHNGLEQFTGRLTNQLEDDGIRRRRLNEHQFEDVRALAALDEPIHTCDACYDLLGQETGRLYILGLADAEPDAHEWDALFLVERIRPVEDIETHFVSADRRSFSGLLGSTRRIWEPDSDEAMGYAAALNSDRGLIEELVEVRWEDDLTVFTAADQRSAYIEFRDIDSEDIAQCLRVANQIANHVRRVAG